MCSYVLCSCCLLHSQNSHSNPRGAPAKNHNAKAIWSHSEEWHELGKWGKREGGALWALGDKGGSAVTHNGSAMAWVISLAPAAWQRCWSGTCHGWTSPGKVQPAGRTGRVRTSSQECCWMLKARALRFREYLGLVRSQRCSGPSDSTCKPKPPHQWVHSQECSKPWTLGQTLCLPGPAQRSHSAIQRKGGRPWCWERASTGGTADVLALLFLPGTCKGPEPLVPRRRTRRGQC